MNFYLYSSDFNAQPNTFYLKKDGWNDWWKYETLFDLFYTDEVGISSYIGSIKIGQTDILDDEKTPCLPRSFQKLTDNFFSLGQDEKYYENVGKLGDELRLRVLISLNDIAYNLSLFESVEQLDITQSSLLRSVSVYTVKGQFHRMATGGLKLTDYCFTYTAPLSPGIEKIPMEMSFDIIPESNPPTNIHVIIGRNGAGKTRLIRNMIHAIVDLNNNAAEHGKFSFSYKNHSFANVVCVAFSAFDEFPLDTAFTVNLPYKYIGLIQHNNSTKRFSNLRDQLFSQFFESIKICALSKSKIKRWKQAISILESDPIFMESNIISAMETVSHYEEDTLDNQDRKRGKDNEDQIKNIFDMLSSGHKIILLTITRLIETVEECTLVLLDEPEMHLHPPLLSAFIRALSELLVDRNGAAIITTHSPVILQEVPRSCVWKLRRSGGYEVAERLDIESFGETIGVLTSEVFRLEVTNSGFHKMVHDMVSTIGNNYWSILELFNNELGSEAKAILKTLVNCKTEDK